MLKSQPKFMCNKNHVSFLILIFFITALHFNKLKITFVTEGEEGNNNVVDIVTEVDHNLKSVQMLVATEVEQHTHKHAGFPHLN